MLATRSVGWRCEHAVRRPATRSCRGSARSDDEDLAEDVRRCRSPRSSRTRPTRRRTRCSRCRRGGTRPGSTPRRGAPTPGRAACRRASGDVAVRAGHRRGPDVHDARAALDAASRAPRARRRDRRARASARRSSRSWYAKPQSSSSQRLNACRLAIVAGTSSRSACSTPQPSVGNSSTASRPCSSITASARVAVLVLGAQRLDLHQRARVDALGDLAAEHQVEAAGHDDRVERRVRDEPVDACPPISSCVCLPVAARPARPRRLNFGSRWRVNASSGS